MSARSTQWFRDAKWGVMTHFLARLPGPAKDPTVLTADQWNAQVDSVDVDALADCLAEIGAGYLILTTGQGSGHYCSPNATYDRIAGTQPSLCSTRDLIGDAAAALARRDIPLIVYLPAHPAAATPEAREAFGWQPGHSEAPPDDPRGTKQQRQWESVIHEWSTRWGPRVRAWWIDGCYKPERYHAEEEPNWHTFAAAFRAGNPEALLAFNPGIAWPPTTLTDEDDYLAGEVDGAIFAGYWDPDSGYREPDQDFAGVQFHVLSFLGTMWNQGDRPRFPDEMAAGYTKFLNARGGVASWDVPITSDCRIRDAFLPQLAAIGKAVRNAR